MASSHSLFGTWATLLILLSTLTKYSNAAYMVFGVTLKCNRPHTFHFTIQHYDFDYLFSNDVVTNSYRDTAVGETFFYQKSLQLEGDGFFSFYYDLYVEVYHSCTEDFQTVKVRKYLTPTLTDHGMEMIDYVLDLTPLDGELIETPYYKQILDDKDLGEEIEVEREIVVD